MSAPAQAIALSWIVTGRHRSRVVAVMACPLCGAAHLVTTGDLGADRVRRRPTCGLGPVEVRLAARPSRAAA